MKIFILSVLVVSILLLGACSNLSSITPSNPAFPEPTFEPITLTGSSSTTSAPFRIITEEWVVCWAYIPEHSGYEVFGFFIYPRGEAYPSGNFAEAVAFAKPVGKIYSCAGKGEYYIKVVAVNIERWAIIIEPYKD